MVYDTQKQTSNKRGAPMRFLSRVRACVRALGGRGGDISAMYVVVGGTKVGVLSADIFSKRRSNKLTPANTCETSLVIGYSYNIQKIKSMYGLQNVLIVANAGSTRRMQARTRQHWEQNRQQH